MNLEIKNISAGYSANDVLKNVSFHLSSGEILCLLGPNGVGKTTLFKSILGFVKTSCGEILIDKRNIRTLSRKEFATIIGYVPQQHEPPFPFKVLDVVILGRLPHMGSLSTPRKMDIEIAENALKTLGIFHLKDKDYTDLSGGERQLVLISRAIAQQPKFLIMDEPTANLDYGNQVKILEEIKKLSQNGMGIVLTTHSPEHAFLCSTKVALLCRNHDLEIGYADQIISCAKMQKAYGINIRIIHTEDLQGRPLKGCIPLLNH